MNRILVIDDSDLISAWLKDALTTHGFEVSVAADANAGYKSIQENRPDLILLDIQLPDVNGFDVCKLLRSRFETRHIPIIMITAGAIATKDKIKGLQAGADDYVLKPFEIEELIERIRTVMRRTPPPPERLKQISPQPVHLNKPVPISAVSFKEGVSNAILSPRTYRGQDYPLISAAYLAAMLALLLASAAAAPGLQMRPLMICLLALVIWGVLVTILVVSCSIVGSTIKWKDGTNLLSLAGLPILFKLIGACFFSLLTSLSPFVFTASPALFIRADSGMLKRFDLFELWAIALLAMLLKKRPGMNRRNALIITSLVWMGALSILAVIEKLGM